MPTGVALCSDACSDAGLSWESSICLSVLLFICLSVLVHLSSWEVVLVLLESFWVLGDEDLK